MTDALNTILEVVAHNPEIAILAGSLAVGFFLGIAAYHTIEKQ